MRIHYNLTGAERKSLVGAISQELNAPDIDQHHPGQYAKPNAPITEAMQKQIDEVIAFEDLQMDEREELGLGHTRRENFQGENGMQASDVPEPDTLAIEMPLTGFTPEKLENLFRLVNANAPLLKAALDADDLPIRQTDEDGGKLVFPWFSGDASCDEVKAYSMLIERLCAAAKEKQRITAKERAVENPKYAMRCFLLSLGFIGDESKQARKILLKNLSGNGAFKAGARKETEDSNEVSE